MRVSSVGPSSIDTSSISGGDEFPDEIAGALLEMSHNQAKTEGASIIRMITDASQAVNQPLTEGLVGRRINIGV